MLPLLRIPPTTSEAFLVSLGGQTIEEALATVRHNPLAMFDQPDHSRLLLLQTLLDDDKPDLFVVLVAAVLTGPDGILELLSHLAHNPQMRGVAAEQAFASPLVSVLSDGIVETVLRNPMVQGAIAKFREIVNERPILTGQVPAQA